MYLKSLKLTGFKSFADRTRLEFRPGVTVVVGPNGSGKSNLVDALLWVLGTQSPKSLRTPKMEDVIFAGTASRPSLSRAEVTLVIDNTERLIDLDLDEVAITRRLYRDGSSDYELNGVGCRLLDIQDLLSDSGVGRHQHVIIGQGEIGQVLNASPEEHRAVIEEAAGILKHRRRKERAERRLERTDEDLLRLNDIVSEIARQMRPLRRQAKAAERYDGVKTEVVSLRLYLGGHALTRHDADLVSAETERARLAQSVQADQTRVDELGRDLTVLTEESLRVGSELERDTSAAAMLETASERLGRIASVAHERRRAASGREEATVERLADLQTEKDQIIIELASLTAEKVGVEQTVAEAEARMMELEDEERVLAGQIALSPEGAQAAVSGELRGLEASLARDRREIGAVEHRLEVLRSQMTEELASMESINTEIRHLDTEVSVLQSEYEAKQTARKADQVRWEEAENASTDARVEVASLEARVEAIASTLEGRYDPETRELVETSKGAVGSLISQLDVPEGLEAAVGAALAGWVDAVAFSGRADLRAAVGSVKARGGGSAAVVAPRGSVQVPARRVAGSVGMEALIDLLGENASTELAESLLGDVVLAAGWASGWDLVAANPEIRVVTPEGDLISAHGARVANPDGAAPVMIEAAEVLLEKALTNQARASSIHTAVRREFESSRDIERTALEALETAETRLAGRSEAMARINQSVNGIRAEIERLEERVDALSTSVAGGEDQAKALRARIEALQGEEAELQRTWQEIESRRLQVAADREISRSTWQEHAGRLRYLIERERMLVDRRQRVDVEVDRLGTEPVGKIDVSGLKVVEDVSKRALRTLESALSVLRDRQAELRVVNSQTRDNFNRARDEHEARRTAIADARERIAALDIRITELRLHREAVVEAIRRDADSSPDVAYMAEPPGYPEGTDLEVVLESKLAELSRMGPINPLAATEFRDLDERHSFLQSQMADIEESRSELRKVITALEKEIDDRFQTAFEEVASAFERYFGVLFPGGRGRIRLGESGDAGSGVLIDAQPMGKKLSQMSLLSGGERSLAALAFLFAIFEARPSPFYVLDEVEAALDDVNLRRFIRIVEEFRGRAQLIIVTHQQQTMEAADVLYGITMEAGGTSRALRKDMAAVRNELTAIERTA